MRPHRVLLVCRANLCRSPMAFAVTTRLLLQAGLQAGLRLDSAGTHARAHTRPDARAVATLVRHGYALPRMRARPLVAADFLQHDQILAMDQDNLAVLQSRCPLHQQHKLHLFLDFAGRTPGSEMPDPYFSSPQGFERVLHLCEAGAQGWIAHWGSLLGNQTRFAATGYTR